MEACRVTFNLLFIAYATDMHRYLVATYGTGRT